MKNFVFAALVVLLGVAVMPAPAQSRVVVGIGLGCCGYAPYYSPYYYGYPAYYAPPPVVYSPPPTVVYTQPAAPTVVYAQPNPTTIYTQQAPAAAPAAPVASAPTSTSVTASTSSDTFTDDKGRSCRHFESTINDALVTGTACLQPDGTWRTVGE